MEGQMEDKSGEFRKNERRKQLHKISVTFTLMKKRRELM